MRYDDFTLETSVFGNENNLYINEDGELSLDKSPLPAQKDEAFAEAKRRIRLYINSQHFYLGHPTVGNIDEVTVLSAES